MSILDQKKVRYSLLRVKHDQSAFLEKGEQHDVHVAPHRAFIMKFDRFDDICMIPTISDPSVRQIVESRMKNCVVAL